MFVEKRGATMTEKDLKRFSEMTYQKQMTKINDRIYHFLGYGHSNATAIIGMHSVILIDSLDCDGYGQQLKEAISQITTKPVKTIIFTHGHPDHRGGSGAFRDTVEEVIAFTPIHQPMKYYDRLNDILNKRGSYQFGYPLSDEENISQGIGIREGKVTGHGDFDFLAPTTLYQEKEVDRVIDGVSLKLARAPGETDDQIYVWLKDDQVMCCGDNYYGCFPALYAIRGTQYRDLATWVDSLNEILSYDMKALLPGHTQPILGNQAIQTQVGTFKEMIEYILLHTLDAMNQGMTMDECVSYVQLPQKFIEAEYLGEYYGMREWAIKSVFTGYVGWFDGDPVHLLPISNQEYQKTLLSLIGEEALLSKIKACMKEEKYQLALQLLEMLDEPVLKKTCLIGRAKQVSSANARHYYLCAAKEIDNH